MCQQCTPRSSWVNLRSSCRALRGQGQRGVLWWHALVCVLHLMATTMWDSTKSGMRFLTANPQECLEHLIWICAVLTSFAELCSTLWSNTDPKVWVEYLAYCLVCFFLLNMLFQLCDCDNLLILFVTNDIPAWSVMWRSRPIISLLTYSLLIMWSDRSDDL